MYYREKIYWQARQNFFVDSVLRNINIESSTFPCTGLKVSKILWNNLLKQNKVEIETFLCIIDNFIENRTPHAFPDDNKTVIISNNQERLDNFNHDCSEDDFKPSRLSMRQSHRLTRNIETVAEINKSILTVFFLSHEKIR